MISGTNMKSVHETVNLWSRPCLCPYNKGIKVFNTGTELPFYFSIGMVWYWFSTGTNSKYQNLHILKHWKIINTNCKAGTVSPIHTSMDQYIVEQLFRCPSIRTGAGLALEWHSKGHIVHFRWFSEPWNASLVRPTLFSLFFHTTETNHHFKAHLLLISRAYYHIFYVTFVA